MLTLLIYLSCLLIYSSCCRNKSTFCDQVNKYKFKDQTHASLFVFRAINRKVKKIIIRTC